MPKVAFACGTPVTVSWDGASLRKHNKDIGWDQTDGGNECNEPLRYLWYACQGAKGKAAVVAARMASITCHGLPGTIGALTVTAGTLAAGRTYQESGKISIEGDFAICETRYFGHTFRDFCEEGTHRTYFEDGAPESEATFHHGKRIGPAKTWWANGKPATVEKWADNRPTKSKRWDREGRLVADEAVEAVEAVEANGSRKMAPAITR